MAQSASTSTNSRSLYITHDQEQPTQSFNTSHTFDKGIALLNNIAIFNYDDRSRLRFDLPTGIQQHFGLLRGLFEFHRGPGFNFVYNRDRSNIEIDINGNQLESLKVLVNLVSELLTAEIAFKNQLKKAIDFESRYRLESSKLYSSFR